MTRVSSEVERTFSSLATADISAMGNAEIRALQNRWEQGLDNAVKETKEVLEALRDQLQSLTGAVTERETLSMLRLRRLNLRRKLTRNNSIRM